MKLINQIKLNKLIEEHNSYIETIKSKELRGKKLILDDIDFKDNILSELNFLETYISSSYFGNKTLENINFGGAKLYDCIFENITFINCDFGRTVLDYAKIINSKFINCNFNNLETIETQFEKIILEHCNINSMFSDCVVKDGKFINCIFYSIDFWQCILKNLKIYPLKNPFNVKEIIKKINIGTLETPIYIQNEEAVEYFKKVCDIYYGRKIS